MRKIIIAQFISLDGVIQAPGGPEEDSSGGFKYGGWTFPYFDETIGSYLGELFSEPFDLLLGRRTYDIWAGHWPKVEVDPASMGVDPGEVELAKTFNSVRKYVATHHPKTLHWNNSEALGADIPNRLREIKNSAGPILLLEGSSELAQILLAHDLVDELRLMIFPLVLGKGKRLFSTDALASAFQVTHSKSSSQGVFCITYQRTGEVRTGSFSNPV